MEDLFKAFEKIGIIPVIKIDDSQRAAPLARALVAGGIPCAEVTFRTDAAEEAIRLIKGEVPGILLGAGTVLSADMAERAVKAGASFVVSPGFNPKVVDKCLELGVPVIPGCVTPSDLDRALEWGLSTVKFFPAEQSGGVEYIKALSAPYSMMKFIPTGGINPGNILSYLSFEKVIACGGSWMVPPLMIAQEHYEGISALCREAMGKILGFSLIRIGINNENEERSLAGAKLLEALFAFPQKDAATSILAGEGIELLKAGGPGKYGHIAIGVHSLVRAEAYLAGKGFFCNQESAERDARGELRGIYLQDEVAGFALRLVKR